MRVMRMFSDVFAQLFEKFSHLRIFSDGEQIKF